jgi:hypothetical protein
MCPGNSWQRNSTCSHWHTYIRRVPCPVTTCWRITRWAKGAFNACLRMCTGSLVRGKYALIKGLIQSISPKFSTVAHLKVKGHFWLSRHARHLPRLQPPNVGTLHFHLNRAELQWYGLNRAPEYAVFRTARLCLMSIWLIVPKLTVSLCSWVAVQWKAWWKLYSLWV